MNAYYELFGYRTCIDENDTKSLAYVESLERYDVKETTKELKKEHGENCRMIKGKRFFKITPYIDAPYVRQWIDNVRWAHIECNGKECYLKSVRTVEDEEEFLNTLKTIEYYEGYGLQELYGQVVFKDNTWLERYEYDGSERWVKCECPQEPDWENK